MGISSARYSAHINEWTTRFTNYKKKWPKYLFRHEPVESALCVLKTGALLSREAACALGPLANDIAPADIIQNRESAHCLARLYFRPRTPTQYHIEGIRKPADYYRNRHAGFLVVFVVSAKAVLTREDTRFSTGNMQSPYSHILDGDAGFDDLDFSGIYHDEAYPNDEEKRKRCAEVLAASPLKLAECLAAILVRTDADVSTMKYLLVRENLLHFVPLVRKSEGSGVFFHNFTAVQYVDVAPGRINYKLRWTKDGADIGTEIIAFNSVGQQAILFSGALRPITEYYTEHQLPAGPYRLLFRLEGCYAHESLVELVPR